MLFAQVGTKKIVLDADALGIDPANPNVEIVREALQYEVPEVKHADARVKSEDGNTVINFAARVGRKG